MADKIADELDNLESDKSAAIDASNKAYNDAIAANNTAKTEMENKFGVMDENGNWNEGSIADIKTKAQNEQSELAIQKIEQNQEWAEKDYQKEQRGAWGDYQRAIDPYGVQSELMADKGLHHSGYSESSKVAMYVAYQNRVATAREGFQRAMTTYSQQIAEARAANSVALAEIATATLEKSAEFAMTFLLKNSDLVLAKAQEQRAIESDYFSRYLDLLSAERQERSIALDEAKFAYQKAQDGKSSGSSGGGGGSGKKFDKPITTKEAMKSTKAGQKQLNAGQKKSGGKTKTVDEKEKVDMKSVLNLGHGPISAQKLNSLVKEGKAVEKKKNGKIAFEPRFNW